MPNPVCTDCNMQFRVEEVNQYAIEHTVPTLDRPYKLWMCDVWECQGCNKVILQGFGIKPVRHDYEDIDEYVRGIDAVEIRHFY